MPGRSCGLLAILAALASGGTAAAQAVVPYRIEGASIPEPLTDAPGNPGRGRLIVRDVGRAPCLICHAMPIPDEPDHGDLGPDLDGVGSRLSAGEIRLRLVDPKAVNPDTIMPSYHRVAGLTEVLAVHRDRPIYSAQEVEDVVAYLVTLRAE